MSRCQKPGYCGTAFLRRRVKFHRHPEKRCNRFPPFVGWRAIEIGAARLLGELLNFRQCNRLARFLRQDNLRFGFGNGRACSVCVSPASNQTNSQIRQTSTLIPLLLSRATSNIAFPQDGQGRALLPSLWIACNQSGLIDSGVKVRRSNCRPTARPSHFSQRQMTPLPCAIPSMEFDKPDKEVQRPRGNDVADQACSRSCGWRGELSRGFFCSGSHVGCRGARHRESCTRSRATTEMPEMATTDQAFRALRCKYVILAAARGAGRSPPVISSTLRFGLAVPA